MYKRSHDSNSIVGQIELYEHRIKNVNLIWCDQVLRLSKIKNFNDELYGFDKSKEIIPKCPLEIYYEKIISPNNIFL